MSASITQQLRKFKSTSSDSPRTHWLKSWVHSPFLSILLMSKISEKLTEKCFCQKQWQTKGLKWCYLKTTPNEEIFLTLTQLWPHSRNSLRRSCKVDADLAFFTGKKMRIQLCCLERHSYHLTLSALNKKANTEVKGVKCKLRTKTLKQYIWCAIHCRAIGN